MVACKSSHIAKEIGGSGPLLGLESTMQMASKSRLSEKAFDLI